MSVGQILTSVHGREMGLDDRGSVVLNKLDGSTRVLVEQDPVSKILYGSDGQALTAPKISALSSTAIIGDSLLRNGNNDGDQANWGGCFSDSHLLYANDRLDVPLDVIGLFAVGGKTVREIINEQLPQALASPARTVIVKAGTNSLNTQLGTTGSNQSWIATAADMAELIAALAPQKDLVILQSEQPVISSLTTNTKWRSGDIPRLNRAYADIAAGYKNVLFVDLYNPLVSGSSTDRDAKTGSVNATDGIHYQAKGARIAGYALADAILDRITLTKYRTLGANLLPTLNSASGGTTSPASGSAVSGNVPAGWNLQIVGVGANITATISKVGATRWRMVTNAAAADATITMQNIDTAGLATLVASGDVVQAFANFDFVSQNAGGSSTSPQVLIGRLLINKDSGSRFWTAGATNGAGGSTDATPVMPLGLQANRKTFPWTVPSANTNLLVGLSFAVKSGTQIQVEFSDIELRKLT